MPIKRAKLSDVARYRGASPVQQAAIRELQTLKQRLKDNPLGVYEVEEIDLESPGKAKGYAANILAGMVKNWFNQDKNTPYVMFTRGKRGDRGKGSRILYIARRQDVEISKKGRVLVHANAA